MDSTATPARGRATAPPVPIPVMDSHRSCRRIIVKKPFDPADNSVHISQVQSPIAAVIAPKKPPKPARAILGVSDVQDVVDHTCVCRKCRRKCLKFEVVSVGIASQPIIYCLNCEKNTPVKERKRRETDLAGAHLSEKKTCHKHLTDYAANALFVLSFLTVGDGGREAERLLGLLDLPNITSMERATFSKIEKEIAPHAIEMAEAAMYSNLVQEASRSVDNGPDFDVEDWKVAVTTVDPTYLLSRFCRIRASTDMGWQQRRNAHDSLSGHCFLFGAETRKPIWWCIKCKFCKICSKYDDDNDIPVYDCLLNHTGSAKSTEPIACVDMVTEMHNWFKCSVEYLIADDDSTMKANCRWNNEDYKAEHGDYPRFVDTDGKLQKRKCTGILKRPIHQPAFLGDPNHRCKCACNAIKKLERKKVMETAGCLEIDRLRVSKNFAYFLRTLHCLPESDWVQCGKAVVDHHFDLHGNCGPFCKRKDESEEERRNSNKFYRSLEHDRELYDSLWAIMGEHLSLERLREVGHNYDTNCNELMNNIVAWLAPKNKLLSGTILLKG